MDDLFSQLVAVFDEEGWQYQPITDRGVIECAFEAHHTMVPLHLQVFPSHNIISLVARSGTRLPPAHRGRGAELLMRTNEELILGAFELRWDHGEVLFRLAQLAQPGSGFGDLIKALVHNAVVEMDRLTPALAMVARTPPERLPTLDIEALMRREDTVPPVPEPGS